MKSPRSSPLYSPLGCGSAILLVLFLVIMLYFTGPSLFSPGKLSGSSTGALSKEGYLSHAEFEQECHLCHDAWNGVDSSLCVECHDSILFEQETRSGLHGRLSGTQLCINCHTDHRGIGGILTVFDVSDFPHDSATDFMLIHHSEDYYGDSIVCEDCHPSRPILAAAIECMECHDAHDPSFVQEHIALFGTDCLECHDGRDAMSTFEHGQVFPLDGSHTTLTCDACHDRKLETASIRECVDCHAEPEIHLGLFGEDCRRCHTSTAWIPAQLNQHVFPLDHGGQGKIDCLTCHQDSYARYSCYGCHEHDPQEIIDEHEEEEILVIEDCISCHPKGIIDDE